MPGSTPSPRRFRDTRAVSDHLPDRAPDDNEAVTARPRNALSVVRSRPAPDPAADAPPAHVLAAFGVAAVDGTRLASVSGRVWRHGDTVLKPTDNPVAAAWAAGVIDSLRVSGFRVPRPVRSLDGRWVVGGWCSERFVSGRPAARFEDSLAVSGLLHQSLARVSPPRFLADRDDLVGWADRLAWDEARNEDPHLPEGAGAHLWARIAAGREPIDADAQVIHCDLFGKVLFAGTAPPAVIGFNPLFRPADFSAAVLTVDAVAWGGAPIELAETASHHADWTQILRRAVLFRLAIALMHPRSTAESTVRIMAAADALVPGAA